MKASIVGQVEWENLRAHAEIPVATLCMIDCNVFFVYISN